MLVAYEDIYIYIYTLESYTHCIGSVDKNCIFINSIVHLITYTIMKHV